jgi:hypothetical protein
MGVSPGQIVKHALGLLSRYEAREVKLVYRSTFTGSPGTQKTGQSAESIVPTRMTWLPALRTQLCGWFH